MRSKPLTEAVSALREVILAGEHYRRKAASHLGLSASESQAVSYLLARGPMGQTALAQALGFNTSSTTALIDRLERRGIAERQPDPNDRRRSTVQVSEAGHHALGEVPNWMSEAFNAFTASELPDITKCLVTIAESLRALPSDHFVPRAKPPSRPV